MIIRKSAAELATMAETGALIAEAHELLHDALAPGVSTGELDAYAEELIRARGAVPSFKGYRGFPGSLCTSVNEQIVHGIPSPDVLLQAGDLVKIDAGSIVDGYHSDSAVTWIVGGQDSVAPEVADLVRRTRAALWAGILAARPGGESPTSVPPSKRSPCLPATGSSANTSAMG